jgi:hypothetical protein
MFLAHLVAAIITIAALRSGEAAFWGIVALAKAGLSRLRTHAPIPLADTRPAALPQREVTPTRLRVLASSVSRRGPPVLLPA